MKLSAFTYSQFEMEPREWKLAGVVLEDINLVVGRNATGKSRMLNSISLLAGLVSGKKKISSPIRLSAEFEHEGSHIKYEIASSSEGVILEDFYRDGRNLLSRREGGKGKIYAEELKKEIAFQTPVTDTAAFVRRDSVQHAFLEPLTSWAQSLRQYHFGGQLGKGMYAVVVKTASWDFDTSDENLTSIIFALGQKTFGDLYKRQLIHDMASIGYPLEDVSLGTPVSSEFPPHPLGDFVALAAKETGLGCLTDQGDMSQGMFRALSLLIHINFAHMRRTPNCLLIDDIGEGLDFNRSCSLIELLIEKSRSSQTQLIMSTNDRFVMNKIPIKHWTYLDRQGPNTQAYNYSNSKARFDKFKFTGLNNFDFLATDFIHDGVTRP